MHRAQREKYEKLDPIRKHRVTPWSADAVAYGRVHQLLAAASGRSRAACTLCSINFFVVGLIFKTSVTFRE